MTSATGLRKLNVFGRIRSRLLDFAFRLLSILASRIVGHFD